MPLKKSKKPVAKKPADRRPKPAKKSVGAKKTSRRSASAAAAPLLAPAELPPAYDPQAVEDRIYASWEASGLFNPDNLPGERKEPFTVMMPPPNATGTLHIGHAMFLTIEDILTRYHRQRGKAALWLPGTDHAAIATNTKVEKIIAQEGLTKYDLGREKFIGRVKEFVAGSQGTIRKQVRKMGASCDWSREAYTLDEPRSRAVREMFVRMYQDGLIYRGSRIVNWCPRCESTLADDEVEYRAEKGKLYFLKYGPFVVATTRPETKLGDTAVAAHPDDVRYKKWHGQTITADFGSGPLQIKFITDSGVDPKFGTGLVGVTPAHSAVDYAMAEKNLLPVKKVIGEDGKMTKLAGKYAGLPVAEARQKLVADLEKAGLMDHVEDHDLNITICYRCGTTVEPLTSKQWFMDVNRVVPARGQSLKRLAVDAVRSGRVEIVPDRFEKVYYHWMENLRDWCISRQIWFGHRIPVWYCSSCYVEDGGEERAGAAAKESRRHEGVIVSVEPPTKCPTCGRAEDLAGITQDPDTLDTWFSSGSWTFSTLGWPEKTADLKKFHPTSVLETGYDILFFWVARMILMSAYAVGDIPFEKVYLHGLVRDEQGRKMSKSLGNIIDPLDVVAKFGTDAVRLSLIIGNSPGNDLKLSEEKIAHFRNFANKLWNIARFVLRSSAGARRPTSQPKGKTLADRWLLSRLNAVVKSVTDDLEAMNFSRPGETLQEFTWTELADWYLEIAKIEGQKGEILLYVLETVLKLWHPFMPFVTEEIYRLAFSTGHNDYLMVAPWPKSGAKPDAAALKEFVLVQELVVAVRNLRATYKVEPGKRIDVTLACGAKKALVMAQSAVISGLAKLDKMEFGAATGSANATAVVHGIQISVPLGSLVDLGAEKKRLAEELAQAEKYLASLEGKLKNQDFVARAPAQVVAAEREKLALQRDKIAKLKSQLKELGG